MSTNDLLKQRLKEAGGFTKQEPEDEPQAAVAEIVVPAPKKSESRQGASSKVEAFLKSKRNEKRSQATVMLSSRANAEIERLIKVTKRTKSSVLADIIEMALFNETTEDREEEQG